jgi:hypothetical protein
VRRVLVVFSLLIGLAGPAFAQPAPAPEPAPQSTMRQPERLPHKPSGFRMSPAPAKGGAYRWNLLIAGGFCVMLTGALVARYLRKVNRSRAASEASAG